MRVLFNLVASEMNVLGTPCLVSEPNRAIGVLVLDCQLLFAVLALCCLTQHVFGVCIWLHSCVPQLCNQTSCNHFERPCVVFASAELAEYPQVDGTQAAVPAPISQSSQAERLITKPDCVQPDNPASKEHLASDSSDTADQSAVERWRLFSGAVAQPLQRCTPLMLLPLEIVPTVDDNQGISNIRDDQIAASPMLAATECNPLGSNAVSMTDLVSQGLSLDHGLDDKHVAAQLSVTSTVAGVCSVLGRSILVSQGGAGAASDEGGYINKL